MSPTPRRWTRRPWLAVSLASALAILAFSASQLAVASSGETSCGLVAVHVAGPASYWSLNNVRATGVSCRAARALVRSWAVAAVHGGLPGRVAAGKVNSRGVIVYGRFGPSGVFQGYTCRWMNVKPGPHTAYLPGRGRCTSAAAVVNWSYRGVSNPTLGQVRGCAGTVSLGHAQATTIRARSVSCAHAKQVIRHLLARRAIRPGPRGLRIVNARVLGWRLSHHGGDFRARRGHPWFSFHLLWYSCGCATDVQRPARLLINTGRSFRVRPAFVVLGMVAITGSDVSRAGYRAGRYGHIRWVRWSHDALGHGRAWVPNGPGHGVRPFPATVHSWRVRGGRYTRLHWTYGAGSVTYAEWDDLIRVGHSYAWRVVRFTGNA